MPIDPTEARWFRKGQASAKAMLKVYERARRETYATILELGPKNGGLTATHNRSILYQLDQIINKLKQEASTLLTGTTLNALKDGAESAAEEVSKLTGKPELTISLSRLNPVLVEYHALRSLELIKGVTDEMKSAIRLELATVQARGLHAKEAGKRIAGLLGKDAKLPADRAARRSVLKRYASRGETIARTEFAEAANESFMKTLEQAAELGLEVGKRWSATLDGRTSNRCRGLHAKYNQRAIPLNAPFVAPDGWTGQGAPAHPNCRSRVMSGALTAKDNE